MSLATDAPKGEGPASTTRQTPQINNQLDKCDFATEGNDRKTFDTLRARLALLGGMGLYELADGSYLVSRAAHCRSLPDLRAVAAFARQMGGCK
jgi:hypothetical protein